MLLLHRTVVPFVYVSASPGDDNDALDIYNVKHCNLDVGNYYATAIGDDRGNASGRGAGLQPPR